MRTELNVVVYRISHPVYGSHDMFMTRVDNFLVPKEDINSHCEEYSRSSSGGEKLDPNLCFGVYETEDCRGGIVLWGTPRVNCRAIDWA